MQPLTSAKPRPPAKRAPSSRRAPSAAPSASPSPLARSLNNPPSLLASPGQDASLDFKREELPDTPPRSLEWPSSGLDDGVELEHEDERAEGGLGASRFLSGLSGAAGGTQTEFVPFSCDLTVGGRDHAPLSSERSVSHSQEEERGSLTPSERGGSPNGPRFRSGDNQRHAEGEEGAPPTSLRECSREELEEMLQHASRLFKAKQQELESFKEESDGILKKYDQLRQRHDSLHTRNTSSGSVSVSPTQHRSSASSSRATTTVTSTTLENPKRRSWRTSLGFPPPAASPHSPAQHHRTSSGLSFVRSSDENVLPFTPGSPVLARNRVSSIITPDSSPTAIRHRLPSASSVVSTAGPPPNFLFSPSSGAAEIAALSQANYALTLELSELEADTERSEREGRKKLRKLEKELQALRDDLDRVEQRNAALEDEAQAVNELAKSVRAAGPVRKETPEMGGITSEEDETPPYPFNEKSWREKMRDELGSDAGETVDHSPDRSFDIFDRRHDENVDPFISSTGTDFLSPSYRRTPGQGLGHFLPSRTVSTSSLMPLPDNLLSPSDIDPFAEAHQDLIVEQLFAEIDELSQAKELLMAERTAVELRLEEAREEVEEWKERCEELEEENVQARLLGWEGPRAAIAWHSEGDADADSDTPAHAVARRSRGPRCSKEHRSSRRRTITDLSRMTTSDETSSGLSDSPETEIQTPISSPPLVDQRTLRSELDGQWDGGFDDPHLADESTMSIVVHPLVVKGGSMRLAHSSKNVYDSDSPVERYPPTTTADDLVPAGSLQFVTPTTEDYDDFAQAAAALEPVWADDDPAAAALLQKESKRESGKSSSSLLRQLADRDASELRRRKEKKGKRRSHKTKLISDFRFSDEDEEQPGDITSTLSRRNLALRRLKIEASSRYRDGDAYFSASDDNDAASVLSSNYDHLDDTRRPRLRSADYYPLTLRARYAPTMVVRMWTDSAVQHVVTLVTWLRFLVVLGMALVFAVYQGPKKTLGLVDGQRRLR
ncbi:hypothetical protein JCM11251_007806 [Rhodosporidiobolus azoricus]